MPNDRIPLNPLFSKSTSPKVVVVAIAVQFLCFAVISLGDIGFDHGGKYGLDWDDFVAYAILYLIGFTMGVILSIAKGLWKSLGLQFLLLMATFLLLK